MPLAQATMSYAEIKSRLAFELGFDSDNLDKELFQSADIFQMICEQTALHGGNVRRVKLELDMHTEKGKEDLECLEASLNAKHRADFVAKGIKDTSDKVAAAVKMDIDYKTAYATYKTEQGAKTEAFIAAQIELDKWYGLKESWLMRQKNLDNAAKGIFSGYINYQKKLGAVT